MNKLNISSPMRKPLQTLGPGAVVYDNPKSKVVQLATGHPAVEQV